VPNAWSALSVSLLHRAAAGRQEQRGTKHHRGREGLDHLLHVDFLSVVVNFTRCGGVDGHATERLLRSARVRESITTAAVAT